MFASCIIRDATRVPTKLTLQVFVCGIHKYFVGGIHLQFGTSRKPAIWFPVTYRQESEGQFHVLKKLYEKSMTSFFSDYAIVRQAFFPYDFFMFRLYWCVAVKYKKKK